MLIECDRCVMRDIACADCVVTVLLRTPGRRGELAEGVTAGLGEARA